MGRSSGLRVGDTLSGVEITQLVDSRKLKIGEGDLEAVLPRQDQDGRPFLQLNLSEGRKILLTDQLIGFKPKPMPGLDLKKLPKVVTTPDLVSVLEAIEETLGSGGESNHSEADMLKKAYFSIVAGAEIVGFKMSAERDWVIRLIASSSKKTS